MRFWNKSHVKVTITLVALAFVGGIGCSKQDNPTPPPPPQIANPTTTGPVGFAGGSCGGTIGQPVNPTGRPYGATLISLQTGASDNSITLNLGYPTPPTAEYAANEIVGSAQITLSDLSTLLGSPITPGPICASSQNPQTGGLTQGLLQSSYISLSLVGYVNIQYASPWVTPGYNYPGGQVAQAVPVPVKVDIGGNSGGCATRLVESKIAGCIRITVGDGYNARYFDYDAIASIY